MLMQPNQKEKRTIGKYKGDFRDWLLCLVVTVVYGDDAWCGCMDFVLS